MLVEQTGKGKDIVEQDGKGKTLLEQDVKDQMFESETLQHETADCGSVRDLLAMEAGGDQVLSVSEQRHVSTCLRCQAERVRYRRLMRELRSLRHCSVQDTDHLDVQILARIDFYDKRWTQRLKDRRFIRRIQEQRWMNRSSTGAVAAVGATAAGAAAAVGVLALAARRRRALRLT